MASNPFVNAKGCESKNPHEPYVPYEVAIKQAGQVIAESLQRQMQRPPREAALASLGKRATEDEIAAWIARHRPGASLRPREPDGQRNP